MKEILNNLYFTPTLLMLVPCVLERGMMKPVECKLALPACTNIVKGVADIIVNGVADTTIAELQLSASEPKIISSKLRHFDHTS